MNHRTTGSRLARPRPARGGTPVLRSNPYGLTLAEVRAETRRCLERGWMLWEIRQRFARGNS